MVSALPPLLLSSLAHRPLRGTDGDLGKVVDFYFDDQDWRLAYVVGRCSRSRGRADLAFPASEVGLREGDRGQPELFVPIGRADLETSLEAASVPPVSLQLAPHVNDFVHRAGTLGPEAGGLVSHWAPVPVQTNPHLRSYRVVKTYAVRSVQGQLGRIRDFIVSPEGWNIVCLAVAVGHVLARKPAALRPAQITRVQWNQRAVWTGAHLFEL